MSSFESRVKFTAEDNGLSSFYQKIKRESSSLMEGMIRDAQKYSDASKDQLSYINQQIRAIERRSQLDKQAQVFQATTQFERRMNATSSPLERRRLETEHRSRISDIEKDSEVDKIQVQVLKDILETLQRDASTRIVEDRKRSEQEINEYRRMSSTQREQLDADERLVRQIQSDQQPEQKGTLRKLMESTFGQVTAANLASSMIQNLMRAPDVLSGARSGEQLLTQVLSSLPFGNTVGAPLARQFEEQYALQTAQRSISGRAGREVNLSPQQRALLQSLGISMADGMSSIEQFSAAGGRLNVGQGVAGLSLERLGIDRGIVQEIIRDTRSATSSATILQNVAALTRLIPELRNNLFARPEFLQLQSQIIRQAQSTMGEVDRFQVANLIGQFSSIDSNFFKDPQRLGQMMQTINQSLANPQNDFARAENFMALQRMNPSASFFELTEMQSRGINEPRFLQSVLEDLTMRGFSGEEDLAMVLSGRGLPPEAARALSRAFIQNPNLFSQVTSEKELASAIGLDASSLMTQASMFTPDRDVDIATISNAFTEGALRGITEATNAFFDQTGAKTLIQKIDRLLDELQSRF